MTRDEQHDWLDASTERDPYWAQTEYEIRRLASEVYRRVYDNNPEDVVITVAAKRPGTGHLGWDYKPVTFHKGDFIEVGGLEGTLLIEELIRRELVG